MKKKSKWVMGQHVKVLPDWFTERYGYAGQVATVLEDCVEVVRLQFPNGEIARVYPESLSLTTGS